MLNLTDLHTIEEGSFESSSPDHAHIFFRNYLPKEANSRKIYHVILQHGMIEHQERHLDFINSLRVNLGEEVIISAMDLYGHGKSGGDRGNIGEFSHFEADFITFLEICYHRFYLDYAITPIFISHSLGGLVTLRALNREDRTLPINPKACIFINPCLKPKINLPKEVTNLAEGLPDSLLKLRVPVIYKAQDLSHDDEKAKSFVTDPLISKYITINLGLETLKATKDINSVSYFFNRPSLFLISGDDRVVDAQKTELFYTGMDKLHAQKINYPEMRHDLLNETCRNEVFGDIIRYIKSFGTQ